MTAVEITVTGPRDGIENIVTELLNSRLIACAQMWPIRSRYWWEGKIEEAEEVRVAMHTLGEHFSDVLSVVEARHGYDVACVISTELQDVSPAYLTWLERNTQ